MATTKAPAPKFTAAEAARLYERADTAGRAAAEAVVPVPMHVVQRANAFDDNSPVVRAYAPVLDGVCGFAWVNVRPGNSSFARWLKANKRASKGYYGGLELWVSQYGQSMTRKESYARAFANVLRDAGVDAYAESRMD